MSDGRVRHGLAKKHPLYGRWVGMRQRCTDPSHYGYSRYGAIGISVCERWNDFAAFVADVGVPPPSASLERIDSAKGYNPSNCRWATQKEQMRNMSRNRLITHGDETRCLAEWAERIGISPSTLRDRLKSWPLHEAITFKKLSNRGPKDRHAKR